MKSTVNISQVYGRVFSDLRRVIPMKYRLVQKAQSTETYMRFFPLYEKSEDYLAYELPDSPLLSDHKFGLIMRWK